MVMVGSEILPPPYAGLSWPTARHPILHELAAEFWSILGHFFRAFHEVDICACRMDLNKALHKENV